MRRTERALDVRLSIELHCMHSNRCEDRGVELPKISSNLAIARSRQWQQIVRSFSNEIVPSGVDGVACVQPPVTFDL